MTDAGGSADLPARSASGGLADALKGAAVALLSGFPAVLLFAYVFRIPIPLAGMLGPLGAFSPYAMSVADVVTSAFVAWVFYGVAGGFVVLPLFGAIAGRWAGRRFAHEKRKNRMLVCCAALASLIPVSFLATLDYMIGPW